MKRRLYLEGCAAKTIELAFVLLLMSHHKISETYYYGCLMAIGKLRRGTNQMVTVVGFLRHVKSFAR